VTGRLSDGAVTIRSNVALGPDRWDLVPGELLRQWRSSPKPTRLQHDEHMYYEPCSVCQRPIVEINLRGCTQCPYAPSPAQVADADGRHHQTIAQATSRERAENAELFGSVDELDTDELDASDAAA
jgi:hypothetical protein